MSRAGATHEQWGALRDTQAICKEYGAPVTFTFRTESGVKRDRYGSIKGTASETNHTIFCWPVETNPSERQVEAAGLFEQSDIQVWTPKFTWDELGIDFKDFDATRMEITYGGATFEVRSIGRANQFLGMYMNYTFGCFRR